MHLSASVSQLKMLTIEISKYLFSFKFMYGVGGEDNVLYGTIGVPQIEGEDNIWYGMVCATVYIPTIVKCKSSH